MEKRPLIITHSGKFHTDDVFAVAVLRMISGGNADIIRTREKELWEKGDYVVDVGGVYDKETNRFDHHQEGGAGSRDGVPYSSLGLVWEKFGEQLCGSKEVAEEIKWNFVYGTDLQDNGIDVYTPMNKDIHPYTINNFILSINKSTIESEEDQDTAFLDAVRIAEFVLERLIIRTTARYTDKKQVLDIYKGMENKKLLILEKRINWRVAIEDMPELLFVVYPNPEGYWHIQAVSKDGDGSYAVRKKLPVSWAGKMDDEAVKATGVSDAFFIHNGLWIGGARTREGVLQMAKLALEA